MRAGLMRSTHLWRTRATQTPWMCNTAFLQLDAFSQRVRLTEIFLKRIKGKCIVFASVDGAFDIPNTLANKALRSPTTNNDPTVCSSNVLIHFDAPSLMLGSLFIYSPRDSDPHGTYWAWWPFISMGKAPEPLLVGSHSLWDLIKWSSSCSSNSLFPI